MTRTHQGYDYTICYNGELYNTEDLRKELRQRGHQFKSHSDTEVLLHSYMEWKEECIDRLNGIFAFTVWDEKRDLLLRHATGSALNRSFTPNRAHHFCSDLKSKRFSLTLK